MALEHSHADCDAAAQLTELRVVRARIAARPLDKPFLLLFLALVFWVVIPHLCLVANPSQAPIPPPFHSLLWFRTQMHSE